MIVSSGGANVSDVAREWIRSDGLSGPSLLRTDSVAGQSVDRHAAMGIAAFYACIRLIANTGSTLPIEVTDRGNSHQLVTGADVALRLRHKPNHETSGAAFWGTVFQHLAASGNAYAIKLPPSDDLVNAPELYLAHPEWSRPYRNADTGELWFELYGRGGSIVRAHHKHVLHFKAWGLDDTLVGHNPVSLQRNQLGSVLGAQEYQGRMFRQGATPGGILSVDEPLTPEQARTIRDQWHAMHSGSENAGKIAVLDRGARWQQISLNHADAQFIQQRELGATEIAAMFNIPPSMIGAKGASFEYKNATGRNMDFLMFAMAPFLSFIEGPLNADEDFFGLRSEWEPRFQTKALLRPDPTTRFDMYATAIDAGIMSPEEAREEEGLPPGVAGANAQAMEGQND